MGVSMIQENYGSNGKNTATTSGSEGCEFMKGILAGNDMEEASRALKAISHPLRLNILCVLGTGELSVQDIVKKVGTTQSNVSQHLCLLRDKSIVGARKDANRVFYSVKNETIKQIMGTKQA